MNIEQIVNALQLSPHPEGGFYKRTYQSDEQGNIANGKQRHFGTAIYFMLVAGNFSAWHRMKDHDELWHHYIGAPVTLYSIDPEGQLHKDVLSAFEEGGVPQLLMPRNRWFCAFVERDFALCGCSVVPGFDFEGWELGDREQLIEEYPEHAALIEQFTREDATQ